MYYLLHGGWVGEGEEEGVKGVDPDVCCHKFERSGVIVAEGIQVLYVFLGREAGRCSLNLGFCQRFTGIKLTQWCSGPW